MEDVLVLLLLLTSFRVSTCITCTTDVASPCKCILSDGASGIVDISPLFKDSSLSVSTVSTRGNYKVVYYYDPCKGVPCATSCRSGSCAICQKWPGSSFVDENGLGSLDTVTYEITDFVSDSEPFSMTATYTAGFEHRTAYVKFMYNETAEVPQFVYEEEEPTNAFHFHVVTNGPGVKVIDGGHSKSNTSGPYPIQRDACTGWSGDESVLSKAGLLKLSAQATVLNYAKPKDGYTFDYFVGVCIAPISTGLKHCFIVQRITASNGAISFHCLGGDVDNQVTDTKDLGWMLLSYTYGNQYAPVCDGSVRRSKIHFFCSRGAGVGTPMYIERNPLQERCFYEFNWPTDILCGPMNTQSSLTGNQSPLSLDSSILIGIAGGTLALVSIFFITSTISICYLCGTRRRSIAYHRMSEPKRQERE